MTPLPFVAFCTDVLGLSLSPAWVVLLRVSVDRVEPGQLDGAERELARLLFGDVDTVPEVARRAFVWRLGRGSGKSTIASALALWIMLTANLDTIGPGMLPAAVVVAPRSRTAEISVGIARALVKRVDSLERLVEKARDNSEGFRLCRPDGRTVAFVALPASRGGLSLRGFDILAAIFDESELFASNEDVASADGYSVSDRDLYAAARPRLHGPAIFISTPWPVSNLTDELFSKNHGHPRDALAAIGASTFMRPDDKRLAADVAAALEVGDDENAQREYFCQAGARGGSRLFDPDAVDACVVEGRPLVVYAAPAALCGCGGDLGLERDSSAIAAVSNQSGVFTLLEFDEVKPARGAPLAPRFVVQDRFAPLMRRHGMRSICMDSHYRQSAIEHLSEVGFSMTDAPSGSAGKYSSFMRLRGIVHSGNLRIPAVPRLVWQLKAVTQTPMPGGDTRITQPRRAGAGHGDIVSALVLGVHSAWNAARNAVPEGFFTRRFRAGSFGGLGPLSSGGGRGRGPAGGL